ncbi:MAG: hypothetical protein E7614_07235 [Ruminococcaceae bacterium]|nr:hypothetical protein [Oscillospiraceae bacterium]
MKNNIAKFIVLLLVLVISVAALSVFSQSVLAVSVPDFYITDIGIAYAALENTARENLTDNGYTVIEQDLNEDAGGRYVYMGYKTSSDYSRAITGIIFLTEKNPPNSLTHNGATFYLVGGSKESNGTGDGVVDLNKGAGGDYIYTYITRDTNYNDGYPLVHLWVRIDTTSDGNGYSTTKNTSGSFQDLNSGTGDKALYLWSKDIRAMGGTIVCIRYNYNLADNTRAVVRVEKQVKNHDEKVSDAPLLTNVYADGYTMIPQGWQTDLHIQGSYDPLTTPPYATYMDGTNDAEPKTFCAVYAADVTVTYDANGGSNAPQAQTWTVKAKPLYENLIFQSKTRFTIPSTTPTKAGACKFLGWSTDKYATTAQYTEGQVVEFTQNTTLYAVYADHTYGELIPAQNEVHTQTELKAEMATHYHCSECNTYFTDTKEETTLEDLMGEMPEHDENAWVNTDSTHHWKKCSVCGLEYTDKKTAHCYADDADTICDECGYVRTSTNETHIVTVTVNPMESGTVVGGGEYENNAFVTVTATANEGYKFVNWTENGIEVSTDATYTFASTADRNLVANFDFVIAVDPTPVVLTGITITTQPTKTVYTEGETFDPASMVVMATYSKGRPKAVTDYTISPTDALTVSNTAVTITYTENGVTKTAELPITVNAKPAITYTITFDSNGGSGTMAQQIFNADAEQNLISNEFTREGFTFIGWNTKADGSGKSFADSETITVSSNEVLYAQWKTAPVPPEAGDSAAPVLWLTMSILSMVVIVLLQKKAYIK